MPDGSSCKNTASCGPDNTTQVANEQCGGATSVGFQLLGGGSLVSGGQSEEEEDCELGIHGIDFYCLEGGASRGSVVGGGISAGGSGSAAATATAAASAAASISASASVSVGATAEESESASLSAPASASASGLTVSTVYSTMEIT